MSVHVPLCISPGFVPRAFIRIFKRRTKLPAPHTHICREFLSPGGTFRGTVKAFSFLCRKKALIQIYTQRNTSKLQFLMYLNKFSDFFLLNMIIYKKTCKRLRNHIYCFLGTTRDVTSTFKINNLINKSYAWQVIKIPPLLSHRRAQTVNRVGEQYNSTKSQADRENQHVLWNHPTRPSALLPLWRESTLLGT